MTQMTKEQVEKLVTQLAELNRIGYDAALIKIWQLVQTNEIDQQRHKQLCEFVFHRKVPQQVIEMARILFA